MNTNNRISQEINDLMKCELYELYKADNDVFQFKLIPIFEQIRDYGLSDSIINNLIKRLVEFCSTYEGSTNHQFLFQFEKFLIKKNTEYHDSLHNPCFYFQKDAKAGILARMDDKLNRLLKAGLNENTYDSLKDLLGYLIHFKIIK